MRGNYNEGNIKGKSKSGGIAGYLGDRDYDLITIIQDNTTMAGISAVDFSDAISNMNHAIDIMNANLQTTMSIQD